jgi:N utilization substance protein A
VVSVFISEEERICRVVVPDMQLSLAIGKEGQNARLAAKLTGWKIDIKSQTQVEELLREQGYEDDGLDQLPEDDVQDAGPLDPGV